MIEGEENWNPSNFNGRNLDWLATPEVKIVISAGSLKAGMKKTFKPGMHVFEAVNVAARNGGEEPFMILGPGLVWILKDQKWNVLSLNEGTEANN